MITQEYCVQYNQHKLVVAKGLPCNLIISVESMVRVPDDTYHIIARKELLQKLGLLVLNSFNDELIIFSKEEDTSAGTRIGQFSQW